MEAQNLTGILPEQPAPQALLDKLDWRALLARVETPADSGTVPVMLQTAAQLTEPSELEGALDRASQADLSDPLARWLCLHHAVLSPAQQRFDRWIEAERAAHPKDQSIDEEAWLVRLLVHDEPGELTGEADSRHFAYRIWLVEHERWEDLAKSLAEGPPAARLAAAHLFGDRLGDRKAQAQLLEGAAADVPLFIAEQQLERSFTASYAAKADTAIQLRQELLAADDTLSVEAAATAAYLAIRASSPKPLPAVPAEHAAAAWAHLAGLVERRSCAKDTGKLAQLYRKSTTETTGSLADVLRVRAAELLMATDDWSSTLEVLSPAPAALLGELGAMYRVFAMVRLKMWGELGETLLDLSSEAIQRPMAAWIALLVAARDASAAQKMVQRASKERALFSGHAGARLEALLLATARAGGDPLLLTRLWSTIAQRADEPRQRGFAAFCAGARLLNENKPKQAIPLFDQARRDLGDRPELIVGQIMGAIAARTGEAKPAGLIVELAEFADTGHRHGLLALAAQLLWSGGDPRGALALLQKVVRENGDDLDGLKQLGALHLQLGNIKEGANVLQRAAELAPNGEDIFCAVGDLLWTKIGDAPAAEKVYRRVLGLNPLHPGALYGLRTLYTKSRQWEQLLDVLRSLSQLADTDRARLNLHLESIAATRRLTVDGAGESTSQAVLGHCDAALEIEPGNARAVESLVYICSKTRWWKELLLRRSLLSDSVAGLRGLRRAAQATSEWRLLAEVSVALANKSSDRREASASAMEAGDTFAEHLGDRAAAEEAYRKATSIEATNPQPWKRLADLLRADRRFKDLAEVLEHLLEVTQGKEQTALRFELGKLCTESLDMPEAAVAHLRTGLGEDPNNREALHLYDASLKRLGLFSERVGVLERLLLEGQSSTELLATLLELADVYQHVKDEQGLATVALQLQRFADDQRALRKLEEIFAAQQRYRELCDFYERRIQVLENAGSTDKAAELLRRKGEVELSNLGAVAEATETFVHLLKLQPGDAATLDRLEEILQGIGDWQRLVSLLETFAESLPSDKDRVPYLHRAAEVSQNQLKDEAETLRLYERIHKIAPSDAKAFAVLQKKLERQSDHRRLVELLTRQAEMVTAREEKFDLLLRAAVTAEELNVEQTMKLYKKALKIKPDSAEALDALARIYESLERWGDLLEITKRQIKLGGKPARVALLYFRMGSVIETQFHNDEEAFRYYTESLSHSKSCLPALHGLRDLHARRGEWIKVAQTLEAEAAVWSEPKGRADVLAQAAEVYATKLGDRATALKRYEQAIRIHRECMPAALALFEHYASEGRWNDAAAWGRIFAKRGKVAQTQRASFLIRWAEVLAKLGTPSEAADALVKALRLQPGEPNALCALLDLCRADPESFDFATAFRELIHDASKREDSRASAILSACAGVLAEHKGEVDEALALYEQAVAGAGHQLRVVLPLAELLVAMGKDEEGCRLVEECRKADTDFTDWLEATLWLARRFGLHRIDTDRGISLYEEALQHQPNLDQVRVEMARILRLAGMPDRAYEALSSSCNQLASRAPDDLQQLAERYHAAGLAALAAGNLKAAESNMRRACEYAPEWPYPYIGLSKKMLAAGDADNAERELKLADQGLKVRSADVLRAQAEFFGRRGFVDRAVALYRKAVRVADADVDDRVNLAGYAVRSESQAEALEMLLTVVSEKPGYVPAYEQLDRCCRTLGMHAQARRAAQVVQLAIGGSNPRAEPPTPLTEISAGGWHAAAAPLSSSGPQEIWRMLKDHLQPLYTLAATVSVAARVEMIQGIREMNRLAGLELDIGTAPDLPVPLGIVGTALVAGPVVMELSLSALRPHLVTATAAVKLGYGEILNMPPQQRKTLSEVISGMLVPEGMRPPQLSKILDEIPGRLKRALFKAAGEHTTSHSKASRAVAAWLSTVEETSWRVALLVTEDLIGVARAHALRHGIEPEEPYRGGLLHAVPGIERMCQYYVSGDFDRDKAALQS